MEIFFPTIARTNQKSKTKIPTYMKKIKLIIIKAHTL